MLPTFRVRNLRRPASPSDRYSFAHKLGAHDAIVSLTGKEYQANSSAHPESRLKYVDEDDGELVTVGSADELAQRLETPIPKSIRRFLSFQQPSSKMIPTPLKHASPDMHVFEIDRHGDSVKIWEDIAQRTKHMKADEDSSSKISTASVDASWPRLFVSPPCAQVQDHLSPSRPEKSNWTLPLKYPGFPSNLPDNDDLSVQVDASDDRSRMQEMKDQDDMENLRWFHFKASNPPLREGYGHECSSLLDLGVSTEGANHGFVPAQFDLSYLVPSQEGKLTLEGRRQAMQAGMRLRSRTNPILDVKSVGTTVSDHNRWASYSSATPFAGIQAITSPDLDVLPADKSSESTKPKKSDGSLLEIFNSELAKNHIDETTNEFVKLEKLTGSLFSSYHAELKKLSENRMPDAKEPLLSIFEPHSAHLEKTFFQTLTKGFEVMSKRAFVQLGNEVDRLIARPKDSTPDFMALINGMQKDFLIASHEVMVQLAIISLQSGVNIIRDVSGIKLCKADDEAIKGAAKEFEIAAGKLLTKVMERATGLPDGNSNSRELKLQKSKETLASRRKHCCSGLDSTMKVVAAGTHQIFPSDVFENYFNMAQDEDFESDGTTEELAAEPRRASLPTCFKKIPAAAQHKKLGLNSATKEVAAGARRISPPSCFKKVPAVAQDKVLQSTSSQPQHASPAVAPVNPSVSWHPSCEKVSTHHDTAIHRNEPAIRSRDVPSPRLMDENNAQQSTEVFYPSPDGMEWIKRDMSKNNRPAKYVVRLPPSDARLSSNQESDPIMHGSYSRIKSPSGRDVAFVEEQPVRQPSDDAVEPEGSFPSSIRPKDPFESFLRPCTPSLESHPVSVPRHRTMQVLPKRVLKVTSAPPQFPPLPSMEPLVPLRPNNPRIESKGKSISRASAASFEGIHNTTYPCSDSNEGHSPITLNDPQTSEARSSSASHLDFEKQFHEVEATESSGSFFNRMTSHNIGPKEAVDLIGDAGLEHVYLPLQSTASTTFTRYPTSACIAMPSDSSAETSAVRECQETDARNEQKIRFKAMEAAWERQEYAQQSQKFAGPDHMEAMEYLPTNDYMESHYFENLSFDRTPSGRRPYSETYSGTGRVDWQDFVKGNPDGLKLPEVAEDKPIGSPLREVKRIGAKQEPFKSHDFGPTDEEVTHASEFAHGNPERAQRNMDETDKAFAFLSPSRFSDTTRTPTASFNRVHDHVNKDLHYLFDEFIEPSHSDPTTVSSVQICVDQLKDLGFGKVDDGGLGRLAVYAQAANGVLVDAIDMIDEERKAYEARRSD